MEFSLMFPSKYIRAVDFKGADVTVTIKSVEIQKLEGMDGTTKTKGVVTFEETEKAWVLCRTSGESLKLLWGTETNDWLGKRVTLYAAKINAFGEDTIAVRVKGSPDLTEAKSAVVQRGRKTIRVSVVPTGKPTAKPNGKPASSFPNDDVVVADDAAPSELDRLCIRIRELGAVAGLAEKKVEERLAIVKTIADAKAAVAKLEKRIAEDQEEPGAHG